MTDKSYIERKLEKKIHAQFKENRLENLRQVLKSKQLHAKVGQVYRYEGNMWDEMTGDTPENGAIVTEIDCGVGIPVRDAYVQDKSGKIYMVTRSALTLIHVSASRGRLNATGEKSVADPIVIAIANELNRSGFDAIAKPFDEYQGDYITVNGKLKFWFDEAYTSGEPTVPFQPEDITSAILYDKDGNPTSATRDDYFQLPDDYVFENCTLIMKNRNGQEQTIDNPKKSDLPDLLSIKSTFSFKKGSTTDHVVLYEENDPDTKIEVTCQEGAKGAISQIDASELVVYCREKLGANASRRNLKLEAAINFTQETYNRNDFEDGMADEKDTNAGDYNVSWYIYRIRKDEYEYVISITNKDGEIIDKWDSGYETYTGRAHLDLQTAQNAVQEIIDGVTNGEANQWFTITASRRRLQAGTIPPGLAKYQAEHSKKDVATEDTSAGTDQKPDTKSTKPDTEPKPKAESESKPNYSEADSAIRTWMTDQGIDEAKDDTQALDDYTCKFEGQDGNGVFYQVVLTVANKQFKLNVDSATDNTDGATIDAMETNFADFTDSKDLATKIKAALDELIGGADEGSQDTGTDTSVTDANATADDLNAARKPYLKAGKGIDAWVVAINETDDWDLSALTDGDNIKYIYGIYVYDNNEITHAAEVSGSYLLEPIDAVPVPISTDIELPEDTYNQIADELTNSDIQYRSQGDIDSAPVGNYKLMDSGTPIIKTHLGKYETIDDAVEYARGNAQF